MANRETWLKIAIWEESSCVGTISQVYPSPRQAKEVEVDDVIDIKLFRVVSQSSAGVCYGKHPTEISQCPSDAHLPAHFLTVSVMVPELCHHVCHFQGPFHSMADTMLQVGLHGWKRGENYAYSWGWDISKDKGRMIKLDCQPGSQRPKLVIWIA